MTEQSRTLTLDITGMTCAACAARIERVVGKVDGITSISVNLPLERADVTVLPTLSDSDVVASIERTGFGALLRKGDEAERNRQAAELEAKRHKEAGFTLALFLFSAAFTLPLVLPMLAAPFGKDWMLPPFTQFALALPVQVFAGWRFYKGAWAALKGGGANMDVLVALGTSAAFLMSCYMLYVHGEHAMHHVYFEASASVITLVLFGKVLEARARAGTTEAIRRLMQLRPQEARVLRNGTEIMVQLAEVSADDFVVLHPGERCPVDGVVDTGLSEADESLVTGESLPVMKQAGDKMLCGALNGTGRLVVKAVGVGEDTTLSRMSRMVEAAQVGKAPIQSLVDTVSRIFVPTVVALAVLTLVVWLLLGREAEAALLAAVAVLVIACPCALGLATPAALVAGTGAAARAGILIKNIEALERAAKVDCVVFDKTGTLTEGKPVLTDHTLSPDMLRLAASAQAASEHPLGKAVVVAAKDIDLLAASEFKALPGRGIAARVEGKAIEILSLDAAGQTPFTAEAEQLAAQGKTVTVMLVDGAPVGLLAFLDEPRPAAREAIGRLKTDGIDSTMLTGDAVAPALLVAEKLNLAADHVMAGVKPEGKVAAIATLEAKGLHVAMVGDGINDAPALAKATVGIAMGTGSDAAIETAAVTLLRPDPRLVPAALAIARLTRSRIRQNLFFAFAYNVVGIPLAMAGLLSPALAGAAMAASSVSVVTNSLRLARWRAD